jgi:hypothetical protein
MRSKRVLYAVSSQSCQVAGIDALEVMRSYERKTDIFVLAPGDLGFECQALPRMNEE